MIRKNIEKKIRNVVRTHIGKSLEQTTTLDGFIQDLTDLFVSSRKKEINIALHEQKKKFEKQKEDKEELTPADPSIEDTVSSG